MRVPRCILQRRFPDGRLPLQLMNSCAKALSQGPDYLHSECRAVHTGALERIICYDAS
jgi:hypothetical protein